jgi:competence protein ComEC
MLGLLSLLPLVLLPAAVPAAGGARIVVLDVGQGLAVLVATATHALLYDTGPRYGDAADAGARIVVPFLRAAGIAKLDALVVSHADTDHSGGARSILAVVPVTRLVSSLPDDHSVVAAAAATGTTQREHCDAGGRWEWDGVAFEVLHPAAASRGDPARKSNDRSCVLRIASAAGTVLLTGDIEALSERELLARDSQALRAEVLVVPHHGSRTSSTRAFISAVSPQIAVIAAGYRNRFGHPRAEILARYAEVGAALPRTDLQGAITVAIEPGVPIGTVGERERRRRYWYDRQ